jgi:hypothetical protein
VHFGDEVPQHRFRHFEVRNDAIFKRTHCNDVCRCATEHTLGFVTDSQHSVGAGLDGDDRWFAQNDPLILYVNKSVCRAQIDPDVAG